MKKFFKAQVVILIAIMFFTYSNIVFASNLEDKQKEQEKTQSDIKQTEKELENVQKEKEDTLSQVEDLSNQIEDYQSQIDELDGKISDLQEKIDEEERKQKERQQLLNDRLVAIYENGEVSYLDVLLSSNNIIDFISGYYLLSEITKYDNELLDQIEQTKKSIESQKAELDTAKKTKEAKEKALEVVKKEKQAKADELSQDEKELQKELEELRSYEKSIAKEVERLREEYKKQTGGSEKVSSFGFGLPLKSISINTPYGKEGSWSAGYHTGIDFKASKGTPVYAVGDGIVVESGYQTSYGYHIAIYHGDDASGKAIYSFYAHASSLKVSVGDRVTKGELIMMSGNTGNVSPRPTPQNPDAGSHLHFEIRRGSNSYSACVNPTSYLPL